MKLSTVTPLGTAGHTVFRESPEHLPQLDGVAEGEVIEVEVQHGIGGSKLYVHVNGQTIVRIGHLGPMSFAVDGKILFKREDLDK